METKKIKVILTKVGTAYEPTKEYHLHDYIVIDNVTLYTCKRVDKETMVCVGHPLTETAYWDKSVDFSDALAKVTQATNDAITATQEAAKATKNANTAANAAATATQKATDATTNAVTATTNANNATTRANDAAAGAEKVDATLDNDTLSVTDRTGAKKQLELITNTKAVEIEKKVSDLSKAVNTTVFTKSEDANKVVRNLYFDFSKYKTPIASDDVLSISIFNNYNNVKGIFLYINDTYICGFQTSGNVLSMTNITTGIYCNVELNYANLEEGSYINKAELTNEALNNIHDIRDSITTEKLADKVVTTEKLADSSITTEKLADKVVTTEKLADNVVTSKKIGDKESIGDVVANGFLVYGYINLRGAIVNTPSGFVTTPYLKIDTSYDILCHVEMNNNLIYPIAFYDKDKKFISGINNIEDSILRIQASEIPSNAVYLRASARGNDKKRFILYAPYYDESTTEIADNSVTTEKLADKGVTTEKLADKVITTEKLADKGVTKDKLAEDIEVRKKMQILASDSEVEIFLKMKKAFEEGDYDVSFEYGEYTFSSIYTYMKETLKWSWTLGLPIGNNCRYYFNNSTLIANKPNEEYSDVMNVLDCKASPQNYELHDGVLINNGGTYCVHDEANASDKFYKHIYKNMRMTYNKKNNTDKISKCIGGGAGLNGYILMDNCVLKTDSTTECVSWHGANGKIPIQNLSFIISDCYFSNRLVIHGYTSSDVIFVKLCNNSFNVAPQIDNGDIEKISYNNEVRGG